MAAKLNHTLCVRFSDSEYEAIESLAEAEGVSLSAAARSLVAKGLSTGITKAELDEALDRRMELYLASAQEGKAGFDEAVRQMGIARKNIGKAAKASYGCLSLLSWLYVDITSLFRSAGGTSPRLMGFSKMSAADVFKLFESSGGALQADRLTSYFPSFRHVMKQEPFRTIGTEGVMGVPQEDWDRLTGESNDAAAIRRKDWDDAGR